MASSSCRGTREGDDAGGHRQLPTRHRQVCRQRHAALRLFGPCACATVVTNGDTTRYLSVSRRHRLAHVRAARLPSQQDRRAFRRLGAQRRSRFGHRRMERLERPGRPAETPRRRLGHLGRRDRRRRARPRLQVPHRLTARGLRGREGRPVRLRRRAAAGHRLACLVARLRMGRRQVDAVARRQERARRAVLGVRGAPRFVAPRGRPHAHVPRAGACAGRVRDEARLHARGTHADHRAPVLRLVGLPDHRLFRAHRALRHAAGLHVLRRPPAPAGHRRDPRLGALALPDRRARPVVLRRHALVRPRRPAPGLPPRVELEHLQLRQERGAQLPQFVGHVLARQVPRRRPARRRRGVDALPRLRQEARRMGAEQARRPREPGSR